MYYENIQQEVSNLREYLRSTYKEYLNKTFSPTERYIRKQVEAEADSGRNLTLEFEAHDFPDLAKKVARAIRSKQYYKFTIGDYLIVPSAKINTTTMTNWRFDITGINSYNGIGSQASLIPGIVFTSHNTTFNAVWPDVTGTNYNTNGYMTKLGTDLATAMGLGNADDLSSGIIDYDKDPDDESGDNPVTPNTTDDTGMGFESNAVSGLNWANHYFGQQRQAEWYKNHVFLLGEQEVGNPQNTFTAGNGNSCQFLPMFKRSPIYRVKEAVGSTTRNTWWTASRDCGFRGTSGQSYQYFVLLVGVKNENYHEISVIIHNTSYTMRVVPSFYF